MIEQYRVRLIFEGVEESKRAEFASVAAEVSVRMLRGAQLSAGIGELDLQLRAVGPIEALTAALKQTMYTENRLGAAGVSAEVVTMREWARRRSSAEVIALGEGPVVG